MEQKNSVYRKRPRLGISNFIAEAILISLTLYVLLIMFGSNPVFNGNNYETISTLGLELIYCDASRGTTIIRVIKAGIIDAASSNVANLNLLNDNSEVPLEIPAYLARNDVLLLRFSKENSQPLWIKSGELFYIIDPMNCSLSTIS